MASRRTLRESNAGGGGGWKNTRKKTVKGSPACFAPLFIVHVMQILYQNQEFFFQNKKEEAKCTVKRNHNSGI